MTLLDNLVSHAWFDRRSSEYLRWYPKSLRPRDGASTEDLVRLGVGNGRHGAGVDGLYLHIPFCDHLCRFCPFNKRETDTALLLDYVDAMTREIRMYGDIVGRAETLRYVYFGGGTPSVLSEEQLGKLLTAIDENLGGIAEAEVTLETHPTHARATYLSGALRAGVTRFSVGIQSFHEHELRRLGAQHTIEDVYATIRSADKIGTPLGIDLLYRVVDQSPREWKKSLTAASATNGIEHISCYSLVLKSDRHQPDASTDAELACLALETLGEGGFAHYASCASGGLDFARPSKECRYEVEHWRAPQSTSLGLGAGAFGFSGICNTVNGLGIPDYITHTNGGRLPVASVRKLSQEELMRRYFVLGAKLLTIDCQPFKSMFGVAAADVFSEEFSQLEALGLAEIREERLDLTSVGRLLTDQVCELFYREADRSETHPEEPEVRRAELEGRRASH